MLIKNKGKIVLIIVSFIICFIILMLLTANNNFTTAVDSIDDKYYNEERLYNELEEKFYIDIIEDTDDLINIETDNDNNVDLVIKYRNLEITDDNKTKIQLLVHFDTSDMKMNYFNDALAIFWGSPFTVVDSVGVIKYFDVKKDAYSYDLHMPIQSGLYMQELHFSKYLEGDTSKKIESGYVQINLLSNQEILNYSAYTTYGYGYRFKNIFNDTNINYINDFDISFDNNLKKYASAYTFIEI